MSKIKVYPQLPKSDIEAGQIAELSDADTPTYEEMLSRLKTIMTRQIRNIGVAVVKGPLNQTDAKSLVDLVKLVSTLAHDEARLAAEMTDEELERIANEGKPQDS